MSHTPRKDEQPILLVEGEKDVAALVERGFCATCNPGGAGKWDASYKDVLRGGEVYIIPDNDRPGREHAERVLAELKDVAVKVRLMELPGERGGKKIKDAYDFFSAGGDRRRV